MSNASNENTRILKSISRSFTKKGWRFSSPVLDDDFKPPRGWLGAPPDAILSKKKYNVAVSVENKLTLNSKSVAEKWGTILANGVDLLLVVRDGNCYERASKLVAANNFDVELMVMRRKRVSSKGENKIGAFQKRSQFGWFLIISGVIMLVGAILIFGPIIKKYAKVVDFYQPFDIERQIEMQKTRMQDEMRR